MENQTKYNNLAILFHWLMVLLIFTLFGLGWYMVDLPKGSPERTWFFALHKSIGLTVAMLALVRLAWRIAQPPPELPDSIPLWDRILANMTHRLLYVFMFVQPVAGYLSSSFSGYKTRFWGVPLPHWSWKDPMLNSFFTDIHVASSIALLSLVFLHISGALYHQFYIRDDILKRMWPLE
ncbi:MAG: cytochrome b [Gammaproteobacteria bacterium]